ncbi:MurR/RpiR family transcriptional regulator [Oceanobacillus oncorhynchi subsp. oncorhynchi]|uniref:MurR/RpiR family transcriptional regulator n=1 Tax=Oceanobacillus TaxID=182709 RepID=UPI0030D911CF
MPFINGGITRINEMLLSLPPSEKKIADYILKNPEKVISLTAKELGKRSETSGAAVIRLCKSLNLKGFHDLKIRIAGDLQRKEEYGFRDIDPDETSLSIIDKMTNNSIQTIRETAQLIDIDQLQTGVQWMNDASKILFIGVGASGMIAQDAVQKFIRINKNAYAFEDMHIAATVIANMSENDVVFGISFSGETVEIANMLHLAKKRGVKTISLTKYGKWPVTEHADIKLYTSTTREPIFRSGATSSRIAQLQVMDILFMSVAALQYPVTVKHLDETRDAVDFFKKGNEKIKK